MSVRIYPVTRRKMAQSKAILLRAINAGLAAEKAYKLNPNTQTGKALQTAMGLTLQGAIRSQSPSATSRTQGRYTDPVMMGRAKALLERLGPLSNIAVARGHIIPDRSGSGGFFGGLIRGVTDVLSAPPVSLALAGIGAGAALTSAGVISPSVGQVIPGAGFDPLAGVISPTAGQVAPTVVKTVVPKVITKALPGAGFDPLAAVITPTTKTVAPSLAAQIGKSITPLVGEKAAGIATAGLATAETGLNIAGTTMAVVGAAKNVTFKPRKQPPPNFSATAWEKANPEPPKIRNGDIFTILAAVGLIAYNL